MYQLMFGLITIPAAALPLTPHHLSLSSLPTYLKAANQCFFGYNVMKTDQCSGDGLPVIVFMFFIIFNVTYNQVHCLCCTMRLCRRGAVSSLSPAAPVVTHSRPVHAQLMLYVFKRGSSVLFVIASAVRLPLVDLLLLSTFIAGRAQERFTSTRCVPFVRACVLRGSCRMGWPLTRRLFRGTPWPQFSTATPCSPLWFVTPSPVLPPAPLRKVASAVQLTCVSRRLHVPPQMAIVVYYSEKEAREEPDGSRGRVRTVSRTPKMTSPSYNVRGCACVHELGGRAHAWRAAQCCTARPSASHHACCMRVCGMCTTGPALPAWRQQQVVGAQQEARSEWQPRPPPQRHRHLGLLEPAVVGNVARGTWPRRWRRLANCVQRRRRARAAALWWVPPRRPRRPGLPRTWPTSQRGHRRRRQ